MNVYAGGAAQHHPDYRFRHEYSHLHTGKVPPVFASDARGEGPMLFREENAPYGPGMDYLLAVLPALSHQCTN